MMLFRDRIDGLVGKECKINLTSRVQLTGIIRVAYHDYLELDNSNPMMEPNIIPYSGIASVEYEKMGE